MTYINIALFFLSITSFVTSCPVSSNKDVRIAAPLLGLNSLCSDRTILNTRSRKCLGNAGLAFRRILTNDTCLYEHSFNGIFRCTWRPKYRRMPTISPRIYAAPLLCSLCPKRVTRRIAICQIICFICKGLDPSCFGSTTTSTSSTSTTTTTAPTTTSTTRSTSTSTTARTTNPTSATPPTE